MSKLPKSDDKKISEKLEKQFAGLNALLEKGLASRDREQIGLKWPLPKAKVKYSIKLNKGVEDILKKQLNVKEISWNKEEDSEKWNVKLDTNMTPELKAEGFARNMVRRIQSFRKKLGLNRGDNVKTKLIVDEELKKMLEPHKKEIGNKTNSKELEIVTTLKETFKNKTNFKVKNKKGEIVIITG